MGIFQFGKKEEKKEEKEKVVKKKEKSVKKSFKKEVKTDNLKVVKKDTINEAEEDKKNKAGKKDEKEPFVEGQSEIACKVLSEPWVTERSHNLMALNKYVFKVNRQSEKKQVKKAIEELYGVKVIKINVINIPSKKRNFARKAGWKSGYKKAIVTLKEGDKIELFQGA